MKIPALPHHLERTATWRAINCTDARVRSPRESRRSVQRPHHLGFTYPYRQMPDRLALATSSSAS